MYVYILSQDKNPTQGQFVLRSTAGLKSKCYFSSIGR